jgi:cyclomaltodextrinase / maltogenic alpha-amylase / neopullulanase
LRPTPCPLVLTCGALLLAAASCRSASSTPGPNLLRNGTFDDGTAAWSVWSHAGAPEAKVTDGELAITIADAGASPSDLGLGQQGFALEHGAWYELSFRAGAEGVEELTTIVQSNGAPWKPYAPARTQALSATMTRYTRTFFMAYPTTPDADLEIFLGGRGTGAVHLDDVALRKLGEGEGPTEPEVEYPRVEPNVDRGNLIIYEVVPASYNGGQWEGGHSLQGITAKLDRIQALGVNCIWLTPVFDGSGMGYWTRDYYKVNPGLGSLNDLKELVYEAHRRDILVILDLVVSHTWTEHPFFQDVLRHEGASPYADYYTWSGTPGASDYAYYYDWKTLPNVNLDNPEVREYLYQVAEHWVSKLDIDGYRVDVAWGLEDRHLGFGGVLKERIAAIKPTAFLLGEGDVDDGRFFANGYDSAYDWALRGFGDPGALPGAFAGSTTPAQLHATLTRELPSGGQPFRFAENHDHPRAATLWGAGGSRVAHTILLTSRGYPDVFGGAEVGFAPAVGHQNDPVVWNYGSPLYGYMKRLVAIRRQYLRSDLTQHWIANDSASVYSSLSVSGTNRLLTVASFSTAGTTVTLTLADPAVGTIGGITDLLHDTEVPYDGSGSLRLALEGRGTAILLLR